MQLSLCCPKQRGVWGGRESDDEFKPIYYIKQGVRKSCNDAPLLTKTTKSVAFLGVYKLHVLSSYVTHDPYGLIQTTTFKELI